MWGLMIICYICMLFSLVLLTVTGVQSYFQFNIFKASYQEFALFTTTFYMFSETLIMFYFIGSGSAIKKEVSQFNYQTNAYEKIKKAKMILFPHLTTNMLLETFMNVTLNHNIRQKIQINFDIYLLINNG